METRIAKKSRFRIDKLEERVAPAGSVYVFAGSSATVTGQHTLAESQSQSLTLSFGGVSAGVAGSVSAGVGVTVP